MHIFLPRAHLNLSASSLTPSPSIHPRRTSVELLGVHQNRNENLVVSLAPGTPESNVVLVIPVARTALTTQMIGTTYVPVVHRDIPWSKLLISSVSARPEIGTATYPEAHVQASPLKNPAVQALKITRPSHWIRNPASITDAHSSFTFSLKGPGGSLARTLAKLSLFVFGVPAHLERWTGKSLATRK
ncbi:hypothetical protein FRC07_004461 [Ceratobasidium sp. 392]|nr:hypothetical protein FRC07_004461 [Ceratobasidium sp. 392]